MFDWFAASPQATMPLNRGAGVAGQTFQCLFWRSS
jgi:hypothetical protein